MGRKRTDDPIQFCAFCNEQLHRKKFPSGLEDLGRFKRRKYCGRLCMASAMVKEEVSKSTHHWRAKKLRGTECEKCGATDNLDAHHRDQDVTNDDPSNIETLCHTCHMAWHGESGTRKKPKAKCSLCEKPVKGLGLCSMHYFRQKRHGDPEKLLQKRGY